ncbi:hypothetical protein H8957_016936, partial [Semnopithecus entellus]
VRMYSLDAHESPPSPSLGTTPPPPAPGRQAVPGSARTQPQATRRSASPGTSGGHREWGALTALQFAWEGNRDFPFALSAGTSVPALRGRGDAALWGKPGWQEVAGLLEEVLGCAAVAAEKDPEDAACPFPELRGSPAGRTGRVSGREEQGSLESQGCGEQRHSRWRTSPACPPCSLQGRTPALLRASPQSWPPGSFHFCQVDSVRLYSESGSTNEHLGRKGVFGGVERFPSRRPPEGPLKGDLKPSFQLGHPFLFLSVFRNINKELELF